MRSRVGTALISGNFRLERNGDRRPEAQSFFFFFLAAFAGLRLTQSALEHPPDRLAHRHPLAVANDGKSENELLGESDTDEAGPSSALSGADVEELRRRSLSGGEIHTKL